MEQIGIDADCVSGTPTYSAWFEFYPPELNPSIPTHREE